jgi:hypothetical protein
MFKILLKKLRKFLKEDKIDYSNLNGNDVFVSTFERYATWRNKVYIVLNSIEFYPSGEAIDHRFFKVNKFIHISQYHFHNITNMREFLDKIKEGEQIIFTAKLNLSAEKKDWNNVKEYFTDVKIIEIK